jgi:cytidylate kinase
MTLIKFFESYERELLNKIKKRGPIITISGLTASGKGTAAKILNEFLSFRIVSGGAIFRGMAKRKRISLEKFAEIIKPEEDIYIDKTLLKEGLKGKTIVESRLAGWLFGKNANLKIFLECSIETRAKRLARRQGIRIDMARKKIELRDRENRKKYKKLYGIELFDKKIYDFILDNEGDIKELRENIERIARELIDKK